MPSLPFLEAAAKLAARVEHELHQRLASGGALEQKAKSHSAEQGFAGRWYNGVVTGLQGKHDGIRALQKLQLGELEERIKRVEQAIAEIVRKKLPKAQALEDAAKRRKKLAALRLAKHGKARKLARLRARLARLKIEMARPVPSLCFGSKKLFRAQHHLRANRYKTHSEWLADWRAARASGFMLPGSLDEVSGNKTCRSRVEEDGSVTLTIAVPEALREGFGERITISGIRFGYGHAEVLAAIGAATEAAPTAMAYQRETAALAAQFRQELADQRPDLDKQGLDEAEAAFRKARTVAAKAARAGHTTAITWRFLRDGRGWRVAATVNRRLETSDFGFAQGAIGVDLNVGFAAVLPVDRAGNPLKALMADLPFDASGLCSDRAKARMGEVAKAIVAMALDQRRPIVIEKLDFGKKKAALKETVGPKLARKLSSFAYNLFKAMLHSRAARFGVRVVEVEPAFSSHLGRAKYARPLGISVHAAAAAVLARRGMGLSEGLRASADLPIGDGSHVALDPPARMGRRHVWTSWGAHLGRYKAARKALAAAAKAGRSRRDRRGNPLSGLGRDAGLAPPEAMAGSRPPRSPKAARGAAAAHRRGKTQFRPDDQVWTGS